MMHLPDWLVRRLHLFVARLFQNLSSITGDSLLNAMGTGHINVVHTLTDPKLALETKIIRGINDHFLALRDNLWDEGGNETYPFFIRSYSSWRSAVRCWASGALPETFTLLRSSLENAAQGNQLRLGDRKLFERWINRHANPQHRTEFTFTKTLPALDPNFAEVMKYVYNVCIDRGAHPNPLGTLTGVRDSKNGTLQVSYQGGTEAEMLEIADYLALAGVSILQTFKRCYPECYKAIGIGPSLAALTLDVVEVCQIREHLREERRLAEGAGESEMGWIRIVRENGVWGTTESINGRAESAPDARKQGATATD